MSVAQSYAKALYESAIESKVNAAGLDQIEAQLDALLGLLNQSKEMQVALLAPITTGKEKAGLISELSTKMSLLPVVSSFLGILSRKGRVGLLQVVRDEFSAVRLAAEGGVLGTLASAEAMNPSDIESLATAFSRKLGKKVSFKVSTDPALLAGVKVTVNGVTYDGTLRSQLTRLRDRIMAGGNAQA